MDDITSQVIHGKSSQSSRQTYYFEKILREAGILLPKNENTYVLTREQSLVTRDIEKLIKTGDTESNVKSFTSGLIFLCKNRANFQKVLTQLLLKKPNAIDDSTTTTLQDSLIRLFLNVDCLQNEVIEFLWEVITAHADEDGTGTTFVSSLLNTMRRLAFIKEPKVLTDKLLDAFDVATVSLQMEILGSIPEIIPDSQYDKTATEVSKLLRSNTNLTSAIIDCLNSLNLSSESRTEIQYFILEELTLNSSLQIFPILFEFLVTDCKSQRLGQTLLKMRYALDALMRDDSTDAEVVSDKVILFDKLHSLGSAEKVLYDGWINLYTSGAAHDHKPIDFLILFMLHYKSTKKQTVETLFRKLVKSNYFKTSSLETLFQKYIVPQILFNYLPSIIDLAISLLRNNLPEFATVMYKLIFTNSNVDRVHRQDILRSLLSLTGSSDANSVSQVLNILMELRDDPNLEKHTSEFMSLLTVLDTFELPDVRKLFELLCGLTSAADDSGFKDELHMLVRKLLTSSKKSVKQRGIIAAVVMIKYTASVSEDQSELSYNSESLNISDLPRGPAQDSATLLELVTTSASESPELMGLCYDELSMAIVTSDKLDVHFRTWLCETVTQDFQNMFVTENVPEPINNITLESLYSINDPQEVEASIHVNIGELTLKSKHASVTVMPSLFRLLRLLHCKQYDNDLASIDALLGCGIIMPEVRDIDAYDVDQIKKIADCTFHCINWFREIISAFVTQKTKKLRLKVIERLEKLIELEQQLKKCTENVPEHKLPTSYFYSTSSQSTSSTSKSETKVTRPKKRFKSSDTTSTLNETVGSTIITQQSKQKATTSKKLAARDVSYVFREMDTDIIVVLKYPLKQNGFNDSAQPTTQQTTINVKLLQFILRDIIEKLRALTKTKNLGLSNLNIVNPADLITDCIKLLPSIDRDFEVIVLKISDLLEATDGLLDHQDLYTPSAYNLKVSFGLVLENLSLIFGWSGFKNLKNAKNLNMLTDCLKALRGKDQPQLHSASYLIKDFVNRLHKYVDHCLYLQCAVNLVKLMQVLYSIDENSDVRTRIASTGEKLLTKRWYNLKGDVDKGKVAFENIDVLVKAYLDDAKVKTIGALVATLQTQAIDLRTKEDRLPVLGTIDKTSFHILYRCLCNSLLNRVKTEITSLSNNGHLILWRTTALTMQGLQTIVKAQETKTNLIVFLKKSIGILKIFLTHGIPILEIMLRSKIDEVIEILKIMQTTTRFLHNLCCDSKLNKDSSVLANVPQFRFTLETFVFRVKAALVANDCNEAFWIGNLKNRDLHGEDIITQSSTSEENTEQNSVEELPLDESDEDMAVDNVESEDGTASEVFD